MEAADARQGSAPYGKACTNCVKAKCRCVVRDAGTCERCQRLGKNCTPSTTVRTRGSRRTPASKNSALEEKLDDIVSLLRSRANSNHGRTAETLPTPVSSELSPSDDALEDARHLHLTEEELLVFREHHLPCFPLMNVPADVTAAEVQREKPILSLAIKTLTTKVAVKQVALGRNLRELLTQKIMVDGERSLRLLLSLLISIVWSLSFAHGKPFLGTMIGLARPLISDLKLDRGPHSARCPGSNPPHLVDNEETVTQTNAGRRAYIACFALSVVISTTMKYDAMRWSSQLESACCILSAHSEVEGDLILVALARLSKVALEAGDVYRQVSDDPNSTVHPAFSIMPLKCSLHQAKDSLTSEQLQHSSVITYIYAAEAAIYELALLQPTTLLMRYCDHDLKRIEYLTGLLQTCKACTEHFLAFDLDRITAPMMIMFGYCVKLSYCLLTLQNRGWDTALARLTMDPSLVFERAVQHCENTNDLLKLETGQDSIFKQAADTMRATAPRWRVPTEQDTTSLDLDSLASGIDFGVIDLPSLEFSDDFWLTVPGTFGL
ncbi:uncharacterized protein EKO05_0011083 [Ascochyta rabiei]|uniref:uncharacterized protein n=1 Tax=Didymella rabiei TaxID=5454 RepID=UPI00220CFEAC|nr:uncharacterized protein EKO05_0011083 [Ascochyta rabiei]UPX20869.1 hypothetical protein EKO05_0011083 [Ascochyta rabiei]